MTFKTRIFGPPGTGKTTTLIKIVEDALRDGIAPEQIAFVSFSRKAVEEAMNRAIAKFGFEKDRFKYFRTLHALGFYMQSMRYDEQMDFSDYEAIADELGVEITQYNDEEDNTYGNKQGDMAMQIHSLSRLKMISAQEEWQNASIQVNIRWPVVEQWIETVERYKKKNGKHDFTDMLENYKGALPVRIFIVDEAQDLSALQWWVVEQAGMEAEYVYIAGDDDQCIFSWSGADVDRFLDYSVDKELTLPRSYRVPSDIFVFSNVISNRIYNRKVKEWKPMEEKGNIYRDDPLDSLPIDSGEWMLLVRNTKFMKPICDRLESDGYIYNNTRWKEPRSIKTTDASIITNWERLKKGEHITNANAQEIIRVLIPKSKRIGFEKVSMNDMPFTEEQKNKPWYELFNKGLGPRKIEYIRSCLRNGQKLTEKPRITVSTIHKVKGGESENVAIVPDVAYFTKQFLETDNEHRVQYVGATRTKKNLYLLKPETNMFYDHN